jgi:hypothetical protein
VGSAGHIAQQLISFPNLGFSVMNFSPSGDAPEEQVERLARDVLPAVRASYPG